MDKKQRQRAILKIISSQEVETQEQLGELLAEAGYPTTQATVSRDMRELKIRKGMAENGVNCYYSPECENPPEYSSVFAQAVLSIDYAMNIVVIKCRPGLANAACVVLDARRSALWSGLSPGTTRYSCSPELKTTPCSL